MGAAVRGALRVVLADDHALVLTALRMMVERLPGVEVVGLAYNGRDAVAVTLEHRPDLVLMDISMKDLNGIEATAQILAQAPATRVLILSSHTDEHSVRRAVGAGAAGYLAKGCPPGELAAAVAAIVAGNTYLSPSISHHVMSGLRPGAADASPVDALTARQREVLQLIAEGRSTKEIAFALDLSIKTAETHRGAIMDRLGIRDVAGLALFAARHGLVDLDRGAGQG